MIRVQIPDMPSANEVLPYLRLMDESKTYVNNGPLVKELERRLEGMCGVPVICVSSGTAALELALTAQAFNTGSVWHDGSFRDTVGVPALTFAATGLVVKGSAVELLDVHRDTWQLEPGTVSEYVGLDHAIVPVATFGRPVPVQQWEGFSCPVVVDAAGAFPEQTCSKDRNITTCFSLHATKFVGCGEGGFVVSANEEIIAKVRDLSTFGEYGTNAKMSEYHAAIALASLDRLSEKADATARVSKWYSDHGIDEFIHSGLSACRTLLVVKMPEDGTYALDCKERLAALGIESRQWYRPWLDERPDFDDVSLPVTEQLRLSLLGIPFHNFLSEVDVASVMTALREACK